MYKINFYNKFFRRMNKLFDEDYNDIYLYNNSKNYYPIYNIHWGQIKLFFSELECLLKISLEINLNSLYVVYIGSAPGIHIHLLLDLFPELKLLLYDPREFDSRLYNYKNVIIKTGKNGWFADNKIDEVKQITDGYKLLYISDIRREVNEQEILIDMINQQKWGILLDADYMLLKMRMPFITETTTLKYDLKDIKEYVEFNNVEFNNIDNNDLLYLDGIIYSQIFCGSKSGETRLYVKKINNKYKLKYYNINHYDKVLNYYNLYLRPQIFKYKCSNTTKDNLIFFDDTYDFVGAYYLVYNYLKHYKKVNKLKLNNNTLILLNKLFDKFSLLSNNKNMLAVHIHQLHNELINIKNNKNKSDNIINFIRDVYYYINLLPSLYKTQYDNIINNKLIKLNLNYKDNLITINKNNLIINNKLLDLCKI